MLMDAGNTTPVITAGLYIRYVFMARDYGMGGVR